MTGVFFEECEHVAYLGYLIQVGDYKIPHSYIRAESYTVYKNVQDLDSYRDANGVLHRTALSHAPLKVEFETKDMLTNEEMGKLLRNIRNSFINSEERKASVTVYLPEEDIYITQDMYMPDIQPKIYGIFGNVIKYSSVRLAFIGY